MESTSQRQIGPNLENMDFGTGYRRYSRLAQTPNLNGALPAEGDRLRSIDAIVVG